MNILLNTVSLLLICAGQLILPGLFSRIKHRRACLYTTVVTLYLIVTPLWMSVANGSSWVSRWAAAVATAAALFVAYETSNLWNHRAAREEAIIRRIAEDRRWRQPEENPYN